ncbi:hypothetical protein TNCV_3414541 [Trichonephila clavipes]|uniref:Uncharacterized protein n=1 Tax=Trichonephila clavipes TaxID=2585209 RepID=A0A8X6RS15_TRICX|nr:hypothetical protein TNCV_3414541 [Trichonephila clavipes]
MQWNQVTIIVSVTVLSNITGNLESKLPNPPQENCGPITIGLRHSSPWLPPGFEQQVVAEQNGSRERQRTKRSSNHSLNRPAISQAFLFALMNEPNDHGHGLVAGVLMTHRVNGMIHVKYVVALSLPNGCSVEVRRGDSGSDDSLRWRAVVRLEACQYQVGGGSMVANGPTGVSRLWNQFQTSGIVTRKLGEGRHRPSTSAQDRYSSLNPQRYRQTTAPKIARDLASVSGRKISRKTLYSIVSQTVGRTPLERRDNSSRGLEHIEKLKTKDYSKRY